MFCIFSKLADRPRSVTGNSEESFPTTMIIAGGILAALLVIAAIGITLIVMRRRRQEHYESPAQVVYASSETAAEYETINCAKRLV